MIFNKTFGMNDFFKRLHHQEHHTDHEEFAFATAYRKVYNSRCRVYWPNLKPLKPGSSDAPKSVEGLVHLKRLKPVLQHHPERELLEQQSRRSNVLIIGCKAVARLVWRCRMIKHSSMATKMEIPTLVIGVEFGSVIRYKHRASLSNRQSLMEIFEAVRDALMEKGITEYGLEVTLLNLLPAAFENPGDGLLGQITCVISKDQVE
ncbi:hypothetical protein PG987_002277 [Apiospora arundinis]